MKKSIKHWILAIRPWSFPASNVPVLATTAYVGYWCRQNGMEPDLLNSLLCGIMLVLLQASANLMGDYYDYERQSGTTTKIPSALQYLRDGLFTLREVRNYGTTLLVLAFIVTIALLWRIGFGTGWVEITWLMFPFVYPRLQYHWAGHLWGLLLFAMLPALSVGHAMTGQYMWQPVVVSTAFGFITAAMLHASRMHSLLQEQRQAADPSITPCCPISSKYIYISELSLAYVLVVVLVILRIAPMLSLIVLLSIPFAYRNVRYAMRVEVLSVRAIRPLDVRTAQLLMAFGMLYTQSFVLTIFL